MAIKLVEGHWYKINDRGEIHKAQYAGRQEGFECIVCRANNLTSNFEFGKTCRTFNLWHNDWDFETWGFGANHFPEVLEDMGEPDEPIVDE